ncbi:uncharacterized protein LOC143007548 [Genypterus blacodes]|uniref:uncharacterized protein LOC143007548 n=1 Tax=Genypterus blacodes TaxID=154954 RepID=UPI003F760430
MASASPPEEEDIVAYDSCDTSDSDESSVEETESSESNQREPCKFYNSKGCRHGKQCHYLHLCKHALKGNCRYGSSCRLKHPGQEGASSNGSSMMEDDGATSAETKLTDGRYYQWQLKNGGGWKDIENDHIIEAQYSLPQTKSIKIYNTTYGAVSIHFKKMRVHGKSLKVRRLDDGETTWLWYCSFRHQWIKFGEKDSKGKSSQIQSADIEQRFLTNPSSSYTFNIGADSFEIRFRDMLQVSANKKRKVARRPQYRAQTAGSGLAPAAANVLSANAPEKSPVWQFQGDSGNWHDYKCRSGTSTECSVSSNDIERKYQQNPHGSMTFTVQGHPYKIDFGVKIQTNVRTKNRRNIRRVMS